MRALSNSKGWVAVYTNQNGGDLNASVISFQNGDTNTWATAVDPEIMEEWNYQEQNVKSITLTDYFLYTLAGRYIVIQDTSLSFPRKIIDLKGKLCSGNQTTIGVWIAAANDSNSFPFYIIADTTGDPVTSVGSLFKYDGTSFSKVSLPSTLSYVEKVFVHPNQTSADTLFIYGTGNNDSSYVYRSFDKGLSWANIGLNLGNRLYDVDFSPDWISSMPNSNGALLIGESLISRDLGISGEPTNAQQVKALLPSNPDYIIRSTGGKIYYNDAGINSNLIKSQSEGLAASTIFQIARSNDKSVFYLATQSGLAYTTAYQNTNVDYIDKWKAPYGEFPVSAIDSTNEITAVAMDPNDPLHLVAGHLNTLYVTYTGPSGFTASTPVTGYESPAGLTDIVFVNSNIVLALKGNNPNYSGSMWRSTDGGNNWSQVLPDTFSSGNVLSVAYGSNDTSIYMGSGFIDGTGKLWKSTDLGQSWIAIYDGPACPNDASITGMDILSIGAVPGYSGELYIGASDYSCNTLLYTSNGGISFNTISLPNDSFPITAIAFDKTNSDSVYIAVGREIFIYDALADTATRVYRGLPGEEILALASGSILAGTTTGFYGVDLDGSPLVHLEEKNALNQKIDVNIFPNPAWDKIHIEVVLNYETELDISISNFMGQELIKVADEEKAKGSIFYSINATALAVGSYFVKVKTADAFQAQKLLIIK
jgi:photosystem II stability/assembly factor-like uncharacterized protein